MYDNKYKPYKGYLITDCPVIIKIKCEFPMNHYDFILDILNKVAELVMWELGGVCAYTCYGEIHILVKEFRSSWEHKSINELNCMIASMCSVNYLTSRMELTTESILTIRPALFEVDCFNIVHGKIDKYFNIELGNTAKKKNLHNISLDNLHIKGSYVKKGIFPAPDKFQHYHFK